MKRETSYYSRSNYWVWDTGNSTRGPARRCARNVTTRFSAIDSLHHAWTYELFLSHTHPDDRAGVDAIYRNVLSDASDWRWECWIIRAGNGAERWIESQGRHSHKLERRDAPACIVADITDRKATERTVRDETTLRQQSVAEDRPEPEADEQLRLITDAAPLLISYVSSDLRYRPVNQGYADRFGVLKNQIVGTVSDVIGATAFEASRQ